MSKAYAQSIVSKGKDQPVTKGMLDEAVDAIVSGMDNIVKELRQEHVEIREEIADLRSEMRSGYSHLKDEIRGLKADLADTPSRREFEELKAKVERHHPTH